MRLENVNRRLQIRFNMAYITIKPPKRKYQTVREEKNKWKEKLYLSSIRLYLYRSIMLRVIGLFLSTRKLFMSPSTIHHVAIY
jgi:hypothetical protein